MTEDRDIRGVYDSWSAKYDSYVDGEDNYKEEAAYFADIFKKHNASKLLDVGCGTGRHSIALVGKGFSVTCTDISSGMLREAAEKAEQEGYNINFIQAPVQKLAKRVSENYDGVLCAGGVMAHLLDEDDFQVGLKNIYEVLKSGGIVVFENRSFSKGEAGSQEFGPLISKGKEGEDETLYLRALKYNAKIVTYNIVTMEKRNKKWGFSVRSFDLRKDVTEDLQNKLPEIGFSKVDVIKEVNLEALGHGDTDIVIAKK